MKNTISLHFLLFGVLQLIFSFSTNNTNINSVGIVIDLQNSLKTLLKRSNFPKENVITINIAIGPLHLFLHV